MLTIATRASAEPRGADTDPAVEPSPFSRALAQADERTERDDDRPADQTSGDVPGRIRPRKPGIRASAHGARVQPHAMAKPIRAGHVANNEVSVPDSKAQSSDAASDQGAMAEPFATLTKKTGIAGAATTVESRTHVDPSDDLATDNDQAAESDPRNPANTMSAASSSAGDASKAATAIDAEPDASASKAGVALVAAPSTNTSSVAHGHPASEAETTPAGALPTSAAPGAATKATGQSNKSVATPRSDAGTTDPTKAILVPAAGTKTTRSGPAAPDGDAHPSPGTPRPDPRPPSPGRPRS
ncbi:MAG: hypothetical protein R3E48_06085 [Burkholderiaceae bacterium]